MTNESNRTSHTFTSTKSNYKILIYIMSGFMKTVLISTQPP